MVHVKAYGHYEILGKTRDDAVGEAFDKVARSLGLGYPGGPLIDQLAQKGNPAAIDFPRIYLEKDSLDFSFSGIKSSVLNYLNQEKQKNRDINPEDVAASFQKSVVEVLADKALLACQMVGTDKLVLAGGVAANSGLRQELGKRDIKLSYPSMVLCTDNAAMIGSAGYYDYLNNNFSDLSLNAHSSLALNEEKYTKIIKSI